MVRTRLAQLFLASLLALGSGCMSSGGGCHGSTSCSSCNPTTSEKPSFMERLKYLFRPDSSASMCCEGCPSPCCEGPGLGEGGPTIAAPVAPTLPAPTPLMPQAQVPPLASPPPATRLVPQPQAQPQQYTPMFRQ